MRSKKSNKKQNNNQANRNQKRSPKKKKKSEYPEKRASFSMAPLQRGDTVTLVRPAAKLDEDSFLKTEDLLRSLGFFVVRYPKGFSKDSYFSAPDEERAAELNWAFSEPGIRAVFACRGGYGCVRTLSKIRRQDLQSWKPKIFVGYSDLTYAHQWIQNQLGWISFHGDLIGQVEANCVEELVTNLTALSSSEFRKQTWSEVEVLRSGDASGKLVGGNLSLLRRVGPAALPEQPVILAIEDVNEDFYRLDRMIWDLMDSGYSRFVKGVILGSLHGCGKRDSESFGLEKVQESLQLLTKGPVWTQARFGHGLSSQRLLALGAKVRMQQNKVLEIQSRFIR